MKEQEKIEFVRKIGSEIQDIRLDLAQLRISVFREFPYLYEGNLAYEETYLQRYVATEHAFVFGIYANGLLVGATTGMPLENEMEVIQKPFLAANLPLSDFFYFGESMLLPEFRGRGWGHVFFDEQEARALENQIYVGVSQTINDAPWSEAVDVNFGYTAFYSTPDKGFPEMGIITQSEEQKQGWLVQSLDFSLLENVRKDGQVFNFKDTNEWLSCMSSPISVEPVRLY